MPRPLHDFPCDSLARERDLRKALAIFRAMADELNLVLRRQASRTLRLVINVRRDAETAQALRHVSLVLSRQLAALRAPHRFERRIRIRARRGRHRRGH